MGSTQNAAGGPARSVFEGRTIQVVRDLSIDEQVYLYELTRQLKSAMRNGGDLSRFVTRDQQTGMYLLFMEDSTRTKESFRNAGKFHGLKVNDFDARSSSFQKKENLTDTVKMLLGYSSRSIFVIRSKIEGVCRWLETSMASYAKKLGVPQPAFINAGDGRHEHPSQEFLDEFSFLEKRGWDRSGIHLALVGDLFHGRTVHSKVEGVAIFKEVKVDLIAPPEIAMPDHYVRAMRDKGYEVRIFESIREYLSQPKNRVADTWYFTRLQLERMGEKLLSQSARLRDAVTFTQEYMDLLPENTTFFHPLPRHSETPTIPTFLDDTALNGWDEQSRNGYLTRIIMIGLLSGELGRDFQGGTVSRPEFPDDFLSPKPVLNTIKKDYKIGIRPVEEGVVIDHIGQGKQPAQIWEHINNIRRLLDLNTISSHGVFQSERAKTYKGIISIPASEPLSKVSIRTLAAIAPGCTLNIIRNGKVAEKFQLSMPARVTRIKGMCCTNQDCISHPNHHEPTYPDFTRSANGMYVCAYCEKPHAFHEIWEQDWSWW